VLSQKGQVPPTKLNFFDLRGLESGDATAIVMTMTTTTTTTTMMMKRRRRRTRMRMKMMTMTMIMGDRRIFSIGGQ